MTAVDLREASPTLFTTGPGGPTLEDLVLGAWEGLAASRPVACPVCAGRLEPRYGSGAAAVGGRCRDCGSQLA